MVWSQSGHQGRLQLLCLPPEVLGVVSLQGREEVVFRGVVPPPRQVQPAHVGYLSGRVSDWKSWNGEVDLKCVE